MAGKLLPWQHGDFLTYPPDYTPPHHSPLSQLRCTEKKTGKVWEQQAKHFKHFSQTFFQFFFFFPKPSWATKEAREGGGSAAEGERVRESRREGELERERGWGRLAARVAELLRPDACRSRRWISSVDPFLLSQSLVGHDQLCCCSAGLFGWGSSSLVKVWF